MGNVSIFVGDMTQDQANRLGPAIQQVQERLHLKLNSGRCSFGFAVDLAKHLVMNTLNVSAIYDEITLLENSEARKTGTKGIQRFKHEPLSGLCYKHYFVPESLLINLRNELNHGKTVENFFLNKVGAIITEQMTRELTHEIVIKNFERRSTDGRLTGEWLIFEDAPEGNYYLTLGGHAEGDENIHSRIQQYRTIDAEIARASERPNCADDDIA